MALTIDFDGTGIVAYADGQNSDTGGGSWGELGAGTVGDNPDVYLYGSNSFASKYASKVGRTYYQDNGTINHSTNGELVYMFVNIQSNGQFSAYATGTFNGSFNAIIGSSTANLRHWNIANKGDSNGWAGGWKCIVIDPTLTTGTEVEGSPSLTATNTYGVWIDTDVSVRADSIFQSMIVSAKGLFCTGTPTTNGFDELATWATDYANRAAGVLEVRGKTYFLKGALTIGDGSTSTAFNAAGSSIECEESSFYNGTSWVTSYPADANQIIVTANAFMFLTNCNLTGFSANKLYIDTSAGTGSTFSGGAIRTLASLTVNSSDVFDGVVFGSVDAQDIGSASYDNCTFSGCQDITVSTTTSFTGNTFNAHTGTYALIVDNDTISDCTFIGDGTTNPSHAVQFTNLTGGDTEVGAETIVWDSTLDNGANQSVWEGSTKPTFSSTSTGTATDAAIVINVPAGKFVKISSTGTVPTVYNAGTGSFAVTANEYTLTLTVVDIDTGSPIEGAMVYAYASDLSTTFVNKIETNASGQVSWTGSLGAVKTLAGRVRAGSPDDKAYTKFYKTSPLGGSVSNTSDTNITVQMIPDI